MPLNKIGKLGEDIAERFLKSKGFEILSKNFNLGFAEIDIICSKNKVVHFVEVKTNSVDFSRENFSSERYAPEDRVDSRKIDKIHKAAEVYMNRLKDNKDWQIDVISVRLDQKTKQAKVILLEQEF